MIRCKDRVDCGKRLAEKLLAYKNKKNIIVIGLPRGGVVTAFHVATALHLPLDIVVPRKIGAPHNPELAIGAVTEDGSVQLDETLVMLTGATNEYLEHAIETERQEATRRLNVYRKNRPPLDLTGKTVILVDDGIATGATIRAAITSCHAKGAQKIILAIPVAPDDTLKKLKGMVDKIICLIRPTDFTAISAYYDNFEQTTDEEVVTLMQQRT